MRLILIILASVFVQIVLGLHGGPGATFRTASRADNFNFDNAESSASSSSLGQTSAVLQSLREIDEAVERHSPKRQRASYNLSWLANGASAKNIKDFLIQYLTQLLGSSIGKMLSQMWLFLVGVLFGDPQDAVAIKRRAYLRYLRSDWNPNPPPRTRREFGRGLTSDLPHLSRKTPKASRKQSYVQDMLGFDNEVPASSPVGDLDGQEDSARMQESMDSRASSPLGLLLSGADESA